MTTPKSPKRRESLPATDPKGKLSGSLVRSPADAERESAKLRRAREGLESTPTAADEDVRATLF